MMSVINSRGFLFGIVVGFIAAGGLEYATTFSDFKLKKYTYGIYSDSDPNRTDRIATVDSDFDGAANINCTALVGWHKKALPTHTPVHCERVK